jgi:hypothetical protein
LWPTSRRSRCFLYTEVEDTVTPEPLNVFVTDLVSGSQEQQAILGINGATELIADLELPDRWGIVFAGRRDHFR